MQELLSWEVKRCDACLGIGEPSELGTSGLAWVAALGAS